MNQPVEKVGEDGVLKALPLPITQTVSSVRTAAMTGPETIDAGGLYTAGAWEIVIVTSTTSGRNHAAPERPHVHRRGAYCPATMPPPLQPTRPAAVFLSEYADAVLHEETFLRFVRRYPDEFPSFTEASGTAASIATVTR